MDEMDPPNDWTPEEERAFRRVYDQRRLRQVRVGQVLVGLLITLVALGGLFRISPSWWVPAVGFVAAVGLVFRLTNWKCPACGEVLPTRGAGRSCPGCGLTLESGNDRGGA